ncbi:MAG: cytochrome c [Planctomycetaceae bacterium]|nr:cytochrome c [Planctomycetaceae bacterium]
MKSWRWMVLGLVVLGVGVTLRARADDTPEKQATPAPGDHDGWMRLKLVSSEQIFKGLTQGEFDRVETAVRRMQVLNLLETWAKRKKFGRQSDYQAQLNAFEYSTKELLRTAEAGDMDHALEAYVGMARSCVRCHELIRDGGADE